ncbi:hypothetical protein [Fluviicola taffensis]|uniref:hypothetical protein n=1 Tax=Fluviicola taffensis TaxID=191579 RepID=UPI0031380B3B
MKFIFSLSLILVVLSSCKDKVKPLNEDFNAICFISNGDEIEVGNEVFMNLPKIHYILFIYHDTVFQSVIKNGESIYSYLKLRNHGKDSLQAILKQYDKTSLKKQLKSMKVHNDNGINCAPAGYFLSGSNKKLNFGIFRYNDYSYWSRKYSYKEIKLESNQFPKIYQTIYHTLNSKQWDYFMSDDYYYKEIRTFRHGLFIGDTTNYGNQ